MELQQSWPLPSNPKPIVIIGAGGIVHDAHMPAYRKAGFQVQGIFDIDTDRAKKVAEDWGIETVYPDLDSATAFTDVVYDLPLPPIAVPNVLEALPDGVPVLIQKPLGLDLEQAKVIREICERKSLVAAVNFQLRYSSMMLAMRDAIQSGKLGELTDIEVHLNILTPWEMFPFLLQMERIELLVHSIHYIDLIRSVAGNPKSVYCRTMADPRSEDFKQTRTSAILDYDYPLRCLMSINHNHNYGRRAQDATFRFEGTEGCITVKMGVALNYPHGEPDEFWFCEHGKEWQSIPLEGSWFPDAFIGTMSNIQRFVAGEDEVLNTAVADAFQTMAVVEACFESSAAKGTDIQY
ncbi:putative Oxidoreductase [Vibrio nigripulchritudo SFn27]|uniref:Putative Oxidoreductase n=1 Tax=Vibrio nigripulchritudo TaxID=28173 RepID=U4KEM5_9VIBR|nr:Gfo/Idh/MocA family oxidoreductase [Vibrio nigripulchritudo]CCN85555.1 putative Oxidoreductase [Vibrio nigripulchritudo BLFn1]CCN87442.1 putative Oxidoreductase [Vibrio nigripulchritudo SFn27]CCN94821.1 putative Oxidoreductase [Vibrio nigripulchritudo ENn2]CCO40639.1 putative Oxidoreductase [Vibrio nigripulchritudo SFn135]CCO54716.1 putative Oxidoreductase [Vibrio nigripulchritudo Wn13]